MEEIRKVSDGLYHVTSEPGNMTRYDFFVYRDGPDKFCFMPKKNSFNFPQRLNFWDWRDLKNIDEEELMDTSKRFKSNPHTVRECIRIMKILKEGGYE